MAKRSLTGIKPTGIPHVANYIGAIRPALALIWMCLVFTVTRTTQVSRTRAQQKW